MRQMRPQKRQMKKFNNNNNEKESKCRHACLLFTSCVCVLEGEHLNLLVRIVEMRKANAHECVCE